MVNNKTQKVKREKNIQAMLPYLQIPKEPTQSLHDKEKIVNIKPVMTEEQIKAREGTYFDEKDMKIYDEDVDIYDAESKKLLARFRKNVIPKELLELGWEAFYKTAAPSRNRGAAAGPIQTNSEYWKKRKPVDIKGWSALDANGGKMRVNNNVYSSVLGYFDATPFMGLPCRLTSYTQKYFNQFNQGIPFLQYIDKCFKTLIPENHKKQYARAKANPKYQIDDTAFSSVTLNRNFRTALHKDDGDFKEGFGNLTVLEYGQYSGGATCFPKYGIGFNVRTGDFLAMDVHEWHCNTEMTETAQQKEYNKNLPILYLNSLSTGTLGQEKPFTRISFVCYLREKLIDCKTGPTNNYYKRINFSTKTGTRKNKSTNK
jgi:hypothetical protein